eukprot:41004_1
MVKILHVAEKPSVARGITQILSRGASNSRPGFSQYNPCYDFQCDINGMRHNMTVTSVTGHIMGLEFAPSHRKWHSCDPVELFSAPIHKSIAPDKENICKTLRREARLCQKLVLWLDCDREGENIAYEVIDVCHKANPRIEIKRARFSSLVPREIYNAINNLIDPNPHENDAVDARQEIDLRIGAAFTRFQTLRIQNKSNIESVVSYGPCQFPTLGFVVQRWQKRENFIPENFWTIKVEISTGDKDCKKKGKSMDSSCKKKSNSGDYVDVVERASFNWMRGHLFDRIYVLVLYEMCIECPIAVVESVQKKEKLKYRPWPLETVELQKRCSRYLRLTSQKTMHIAERLYQRGFISYPRTETNKFPNGLNLRNLVQQHRNSNEWGDYVGRLLEQNGYRNPSQGKKDDKAHPPIHPTKFDQNAYDNFSNDEKRVYEFVVRHFLACVSEHAKGHESKVIINIASEQFITTGLIVLERNFLDIYKYDRWNGKVIPEFLENQTFTPDSILMTEGITTAPQLLTEEELISLMDKHGIGTDATMAQHIETIQTRDYAYKRDRRFVPKELGIGLCNAYERMGKTLSKPFLRANMEASMKRIAEGQMDKTEFIRECLAQMKQIFIDIQQNATTLDTAIAEFFGRVNNEITHDIQRGLCECGQCGNGMTLRGRGRINGNNRRGRGHGGDRTNGFKSRHLYCSNCANARGFNPNQISELRMPLGTLTSTEHRCPICRYQILNVKNEETQKEHRVCPYCFNNPPSDQITHDNTFINGFRCFQCKHINCTFAGGNGGGGASIIKSHGCQYNGDMSMRFVGKVKKFVVGCSKWREGCKDGTIWFPSTVKEGSKVSGVNCNKCGAKKVDMVLDRNNGPPGIPGNHNGCIMPGCDSVFSELVEFEKEARFGGGYSSNSNRDNNNNNRGNNNNNNGDVARVQANRHRDNRRSIGNGRLVQSRINMRPSNGEGYLIGSNNRGVSVNNYNNNNNNNNNNNRMNSGNPSGNAFSYLMDNSNGKRKKGRGRGRGRGRG